MKILCVIPARGGSKKIIGKNIKLLYKKPLIYYTINEAKKSKLINRIVVSTDDEKIRKIALRYGAQVPFLRPKKLAGDYVSDLPVFQHCLNWLKEKDNYEPDIVVHLRPTAPLRRARDIDQGIKLLLDLPRADSVRSVTGVGGTHPLKMWRVEKTRLLPFISEEMSGIKESYNFPRQKLPKAYRQNGSVDVIWTRTILKKNTMSGDIIIPFIMNEMDSVNIDDEIDFLVAEQIMRRRKKRHG